MEEEDQITLFNKGFAAVFLILIGVLIFTVIKKYKIQNGFEICALTIIGLSLLIREAYCILKGFRYVDFQKHINLNTIFMTLPTYLQILLLLLVLRPWVELYYRLKY